MLLSYSLISLSFFILLIFIKKFGLTIRTIGALFIFLTHFLGYPLLHIRSLLSESYPRIEDMGLDEGVVLSFYGLLIFMVVCSLFPKTKLNFDSVSLKKSLNLRVLVNIYWFLFTVSILLYFVKNGVSFNSDGHYGDRLEENAGNGLLLINMAAFIPAIIVSFFMIDKRKELVILVISIIISGVAYFVIIGGSRNILAGGLVIFLILAFSKGFISKKSILLYSGGVLVFMNVLVLKRYNIDLSEVDVSESLAIFISYFADSVSPLYYQAESVKYFLNSSVSITNGIDLFFNQFLAIVPRVFWEDKPIVMLNSSYYFTQYILGMKGNLNMAATMLSSSLVIFGVNFYLIIYIISAIFLVCLDYGVNSKFLPIKILAIMAFPFTFFMARESLELYAFMILKYAIMIFIGYFLALFITYVLPKKQNYSDL